MTLEAARRFVRKHGIVLESGRGPVPNFAEAIAGESIRGSWWAHPKSHEIFSLTRGIREWDEVMVCRVVEGKVTYVHRRLWPALIRLARWLGRERLAAIREVHTATGRHEVKVERFPQWAPADARQAAKHLTVQNAASMLGGWAANLDRLSSQARARVPRAGTRRSRFSQ